jgi:hypothetical protein
LSMRLTYFYESNEFFKFRLSNQVFNKPLGLALLKTCGFPATPQFSFNCYKKVGAYFLNYLLNYF